MSHHTRTQYIVANGQREFDLAVRFLEKSHISVRVNGIMAPVDWVGESRVRLMYPAPDGSVVLIQRITPIDDALVTFHNGSNLTKEELNRAVLQLLYQVQEQDDLLRGSLDQARVRLGDQLGVVTTPEAIVDELLRISELGDDLLNRFRDALANIDLSAERILDQAFKMENLTAVVDALANLDDGTGLATIIQNEAQQRADGDTALANTLALIGAKSADKVSFILDTNKVKASPTETLAQRFAALYAADGSNLALIQSEQNARINADGALTNRLDTMGAKVTDNEAAIVNEATARATAINAEALARQSLATKVNANEAAIQSEASARSTADTALANTLAILGAKNGAGSAFILDINKVQVDGSTSLGTRLSGIDAKAANAAAAVVTEQTARINGDNALSQTLSTVSNTVNGLTGSITSLTQVTDGLNLKHGVTLNSNGHITGFIQNNNGRTGSATFVVDEFGIVAPGGGTPIKPFTVTAGKARFNTNVEINGDLVVNGTIKTEGLAMSSVTNPVTSYSAAEFQYLASYTGIYKVIRQVTITTTGGRVEILGNFNIESNTSGGRITMWTQVLRNGFAQLTTFVRSNSENSKAEAMLTGPQPVMFTDTPPAGTHTYTLHARFEVAGGTLEGTSWWSTYLSATEVKR